LCKRIKVWAVCLLVLASMAAADIEGARKSSIFDAETALSLFFSSDANQNGGIEYSEASGFLQYVNPQIFALMDLDEDGTLSLPELFAAQLFAAAPLFEYIAGLDRFRSGAT
jgi:hypothetical protein